jgi:putative transposase
VTVRCVRAQYRLRPDRTRTRAVACLLADAMTRFPDLEVHAVVVMSNHLHLCVTDGRGELSAFMCRVLGRVAKAVNELDRGSAGGPGARSSGVGGTVSLAGSSGVGGTVSLLGPVFERRYSAIEIVDDDAMLDRIVYTVTNPAAAGLVRNVEAWAGLSAWVGGTTKIEGELVRRAALERARHKARVRGADPAGIDVEAFTQRASASITPFAIAGRDVTAELRERIQAGVAELQAKRGKASVLGMVKARAQSVWDAPSRPKRGPMPLCHASTPEHWRAYRDGWREFVAWFRSASERFRSGDLDVTFPPWSFRPSIPTTG